LAESVQGLVQLREEGKVRHIGVSNVTLEQVKEVAALTTIASVQNRFSVAERGSDPIVDFCAREGIAFLPYGPLGADPMQAGAPLAAGEGALGDVARELKATPTQVALGWLLHRAANLIPIPGTRSELHLEENVRSQELAFSSDQLERLAGLARA
jgi:pyridoxine 4-dehydrogenase